MAHGHAGCAVTASWPCGMAGPAGGGGRPESAAPPPRAFQLQEKAFRAEDPVSRDSELAGCETQISKGAGACAPPPPTRRRAGTVGRRLGWAGQPGTAKGRRWPAERRAPGPRTRALSSLWLRAPRAGPCSRRAYDPSVHRGRWRKGTAETTRARAGGVQGPGGHHRPLAAYLALVMR